MSRILKRPVMLVGMMGTGKSHVGRILAERLGLPFHDMDALIEQSQGKTIGDIFRDEGEKGFRALESALLAELLQGPPGVISGGGGVVLDPQNLNCMKQGSLMIWLEADAQTIWGRISAQPHRPLLQTHDPIKTLQELIEARTPLYAQAHMRLHVASKSPEEIADAMILLLSQSEFGDRV